MSIADSHKLPSLHLHLQACPDGCSRGELVGFRAFQLPELQLDAHEPLPPMECSFEEVYESLCGLERLFAELDGSFVWRGLHASQEWQVDGMLYDHQLRVQRCELKGSCPLEQWHQLLSCFGWPQQSLMAHWVDDQVFTPVNELQALWQVSDE